MHAPQAEFPQLERPLARAVAACLLQAGRLGCAPLPLSRAVPALHPGLEAALQGKAWDSRCAEQHIAHLDRAETELDAAVHATFLAAECAQGRIAESNQPSTGPETTNQAEPWWRRYQLCTSKWDLLLTEGSVWNV